MSAKRPRISEAERELAEKVATGCRILFDMNLITFMGHVTARVPCENAFLYGFNRPTLGNTKASDVMKIGLDGRVIRGKYRVGVELPMYTGIYQARPDVNCAIHAHLPGVIALYSTGKEIVPVTASGVQKLKGGIKIWEAGRTITRKEQADEMIHILGDSNVCIIMGHGVFVVGTRVEDTVFRVMELENQARLNIMAWQVGTPRTPDVEQEVPEELSKMNNDRTYRHGQFVFYGDLATPNRKSKERRPKLALPLPVW